MKVNLLLGNPKGCVAHFANIDPLADGNDGRNKGDISTLDWLCDTAGLEHLIADDILPYFPFPKINDILKNWISKIALGGKITIKGVDFEEVCRALTLEKITLMEASKLLWGEQKDIWDVKKSGVSILELVGYLEDAGLKVSKKVFEDYIFCVEAIREV
jgi:hypothetical protein